MPVFKNILIALDGSALAEQSLGLVSALQGEDQAKRSLLRVVPPLAEDEDVVEELASANRYLEGVSADHCGGAGKVIVRQSADPAEQILEESAGHDLVALMTHGRGGLKRWALGSVAERVVRRSQVPVLLGSARGKSPQPTRIQRILVPLDRSERAEEVLSLAQALGTSLDAELVLFTSYYVDPTDNALLYARIVADERARAQAYLDARVQDLVAKGLRAKQIVNSAYPAAAILDLVEKSNSDLIAMSTHGRSGVKRWFLGSVAEKVSRASPRPVLLLRDRPAE